MKRGRENGEMESIDMAKCLMLLSHSLETKPKKRLANEVFECKTCNRQFPSFQALGGHRASHKRPRFLEEKPNGDTKSLSIAMKPKTHECSICGLKFATGQALGGHMRRHRTTISEEDLAKTSFPVVSKMPVLKRSNSSKRVLSLDLNLTPLENDLEFLFGKMAPKVNPFI